MPISINPAIAVLQGSLEQAGLIAPLDSDAVTQQAADAGNGLYVPPPPVDWSIIINDVPYSGTQFFTPTAPPADDTGEDIPDGGS